ncbi:3-phytase [Aureobasidium melanogenum CBS 110374]|uniref:3-phytase n=1 Tax=Aureobasidium melanogenum (strain CBS 110374) TaxID=1043003 RepID=A0A074VKZ6_AURM1|nr:3-phytase [Aureobasidium melanogenum CBS 110374]KEQ58327.1 3-phytase [Aureobasidium melanogenum CBS 110374]
MLLLSRLAAMAAVGGLVTALPPSPAGPPIVNSTICGGHTYIYQELAGYGFVKSDARDKFGDTLGGIGSSIAIDQKTWKKMGPNSYQGILWALPDRGWNTQGTLNYQNRVHKFLIKLSLQENATVEEPSGPNLHFDYLDTILFTDPRGTPVTGLDADATGPYLQFSGFPDVPSATYTGDGFGNNGTGGHRVSVDSEGLILNPDGSFYVSDEYGPYIYHFSASGKMVQAIRPPDAYIPLRNGTESFSADSPPIYDLDEEVNPEDPTQGRANNQGLEGLTASPDGKHLYALMQSALNQEGGLKKKNRRYARLLQYSIPASPSSPPVYSAEYVVPLPLYNDNDKVAAQSEIHFLTPTQFFILARDSNAGHGQASSTSIYRHLDIFDISNATNIASATYDAFNASIASSKGVLNTNIQPATYCTFLDFNVNAQLNRFGVHNGGAQDAGLLNEKWESIATVPVTDGVDGEYFVFSLSDNDFVTQNGFMDGGKYSYKDASGYNLDNQALVFKVQVPKGVHPS